MTRFRRAILRMSPLHILWMLPLFILLGGVFLRSVAGERLTTTFLVGVPGLGILAAVFGAWLARIARREVAEELERRTRELRESRDFLQQLVASLPVAAIIGNFDGRVIFASPQVELLLGRSPEEMAGMRVSDLYLDGEEEFNRVRRLIAESDGHLDSELTVGVTPDGDAVPIELSARFLEGPDGKPIATLGVLTDAVISREHVERQIEAERLRILGEYVAGIAHELNNPLTSVIGHLQLTEKDGLPAAMRDSLLRVEGEAKRMARTLRVLLDFVRRSPPERVATDLNEAVREICDFQSRPLRANGIELVCEFAELPLVMADPNQIRQVVLNLVKNAEDAIRSSGVGGRIVARTLRAERGFRIEVEDDGPGVEAMVREKIFENFFTTKPAGAGTGLGLSISRRIAEAHGGRIRHRISPTGGACFVLELPVPVAAKPREKPPPAPPPEAALKLLVVDDQDSVRDYVAAVLAGDGHEVVLAGDSREALRAIDAAEPDAVFLDMNLPDQTGTDCERRILELAPALVGRIIFMSGDHRSATGDAPFLAKPMAPEQIREALAEVVHASVVATGAPSRAG